MPRNKNYDYDDYDDGYDDGDYYDEYDEAPAPPPKPKPKPKPAPAPKKKQPPAAAAGASPMAQAGKGKAGAAVGAGAAYSVAPAAAGPSGGFDFSSPSPDDVISAAQAQKAKGPAISHGVAPAVVGPAASPVVSTPPSGKSAAPPADELKGLGLGEGANAAAGTYMPTRPMSDFVADEAAASACARAHAEEEADAGKERIHLVVVGHVDAGKSTMMGRLLFMLGEVDQKQVHKNEKQAKDMGKGSFSWAWLLDERGEERERGVTVDVAQGHFTTQHRSVTLLDAPGHRDFVPNMISGASQADAAVLVVDASPGGFESGFEAPKAGLMGQGGGQTREHAQLARSLGVEQIAVAVNKLDSVDYDQGRFEEIKSQLGPFLKTCGFKEDKVTWLPVSGFNGENLTEKSKDPKLAWWGGGPCLTDVIDMFKPPARSTRLPLRMPVAEVTKSRTLGQAAVAGKIEAGMVTPGAKVVLMPGRLECTVKAVERKGKGVGGAQAGDSVDVGLNGVDPNALHGGMVLCPLEWPVAVVKRIEARVVVLDIKVPILSGTQAVLHAHTAREPAKVAALKAILDPKTGEVSKKKPRCLVKGQTATVEIVPQRPICCELYSDVRALGRVTLRDGSHTVAVGIVTGLVG